MTSESSPRTESSETATLFRRWNALSKRPGDLSLVRDHVQTVLTSARGASEPEALDLYAGALEFLGAQAARVEPEQIDALAALADEVVAKRDALMSTPTESEDEPVEDPAADRLRSLRTSLPNVPATSGGLRTLAAELAAVQDHRQDVLDGPFPELDALIGHVQTALHFERAREEGNALLMVARQEPDPSVRAYVLQACESHVRQCLVLDVQVGAERAEAARALLNSLKVESERVRTDVQRADSDAVWKAFQTTHADAMASVKAWTPPPSGSQLDGSCTAQIKAIGILSRAFQSVASQITHPDVQAQATRFADDLGIQAEEAQQAQHRRYNAYAVRAIRKGYMKGIQHAGLIDDEVKIGKAVIDFLGPIDTRYLTSEVQRCYSETFEYLYGRLDRPGDKGDFGKASNKLYAVAQMFEKDKTPLHRA